MALPKLPARYRRIANHDYVKALAEMLTDNAPGELQVSVVVGKAVNTNIAITGIGAASKIAAVVRFEGGTKPVSNLIGEVKARTTGNIQLGTTNTSADQLVVLWYK